MDGESTIVAVASGSGGAISLIRVSGDNAIDICSRIIKTKDPLSQAKGYTIHYGEVKEESQLIDDVIVSVFRSPRSYTGENMVEISCHASKYIVREIVALLIKNGARVAQAGEFTVRAFLNGKIDLSQAEAVADIIASENRASHSLAQTQMRGGYSAEFSTLRDRLIELVSLLELELDFSEEDVEFADRGKLKDILDNIGAKINTLKSSFALGNVLKNGVSVAIVGEPNVGKSTLLNRLLNDDRAMVSDIAGTTRDIIEESITIDGICFRFVDTAGIRATDDKLEKMGIERTFNAVKRAHIVLLLVESGAESDIKSRIESLNLGDDQMLCVVANKCDVNGFKTTVEGFDCCHISAKSGLGIEELKCRLMSYVDVSGVYNGDSIVSNERHYEALTLASEAVDRVYCDLEIGISADLMSQDIREILHHIGTITGEITTNDILASIFSKFCIGK